MSRSPSGPSPRREAAVTRDRRRAALTLAGAGLLLAAAALLVPAALGSEERGGGSGRVRAVEAPAPFDSRSADLVARRVGTAQADVTAVWRHDFRVRLGRAYAPPEVIHFTGRRPSPCRGAEDLLGPAYCALDRTASLDLVFLAGLAATLGSEGERAVTLVVARIGAEHVQAELAILGDAARARHGLEPDASAVLDRDLALQGDCLTGVWARRAARSIGAVEPGLWGLVVAAVRTASPEAALAAGLEAGEAEAREAAFAGGYETGEIRDCLLPGLGGVLG